MGEERLACCKSSCYSLICLTISPNLKETLKMQKSKRKSLTGCFS